MRLLTSALCATVASSLLQRCAGNFSVPTSRVVQLRQSRAASKAIPSSGIYISQFYGSEILGYAPSNKQHRLPLCNVRAGMYVNDVAVDGQGNLIVPGGASKNVVVYQGPKMCGKRLGPSTIRTDSRRTWPARMRRTERSLLEISAATAARRAASRSARCEPAVRAT